MKEENLSPDQADVLRFLRTSSAPVLLTGVAGCGKSSVLNLWREELNQDERHNVAVVAPTGVAALNVEGSTIHRLFGIRPQTNLMKREGFANLMKLSLIDTLIIDEISMVRADLLHYMDNACRAARDCWHVPFGGIRVVMVGDYWQLPPVVDRKEQAFLLQHFGSYAGWNFLAPAFQQLAPRVFFLTHSFRQADDASFARVLNGVRRLEDDVVPYLNQYAPGADAASEDVPWLCARRDAALLRNRAGLARCEEPAVRLQARIEGDATRIPRDVKTSVDVAVGCRVMITANGEDYVNGDVGTLVDLESSCRTYEGRVPALRVRVSGCDVLVPETQRDIIDYAVTYDEEGRLELKKTVVASLHMYPVDLGYAWTIHKSQGQTLDNAVIDLGFGAFAHGQTYVALSRVRSLSGLYLAQRLKPKDLILDPSVPQFFGHY